MGIKKTIQLDISVSSAFELTPKINALKELAKKDTEALQILAELATPKGIEQLKANKDMIKGFLS
jgi:hypothetical protein